VNNLHVITLYKLHNKLSGESRLSRSSCRVCRSVLFDKIDTTKMHGLHTSSVSRRDVTSQVEFGLMALLAGRSFILACHQALLLVLLEERWCSEARKITVGLASHWPCVTDFVVIPPAA